MRITLLVAPLLLAGCAGLGEAVFGHCGPHDTLEWRDASLYEALGALPHGQTAAPAGLADAAPLGAPRGVVTSVQWAPDGQARELSRVTLGVATLEAQAADDEEARAILAAFLANASAATEPERASLVEAALANKTQGVAMYRPESDDFVTVAWTYAAAATGPWQAAALVEDADATQGHATTGSAVYHDAPYAFTVAFPTREATLDGIPLKVDASGFATAVPGERGDGTREDSIERVRVALSSRGLPAPAEPEVRTMVC